MADRRMFAFCPGDGYVYMFEKVSEDESEEAIARMIDLILNGRIEPVRRLPIRGEVPETRQLH